MNGRLIRQPLCIVGIVYHSFMLNNFSSVGGLVVLFPLFSSFCKQFTGQFALALSVSSNYLCFLEQIFSVYFLQAAYSVVVTMYLIGVLPTFYLFLQIVVIWAAYHTNSAK